MWFKSMQVYQINAAWQMTRDQLMALLEEQAFQPCGAFDDFSMGWVPPIEGGDLVHGIQDQWMLKLQYETRLLPQSVVNQVLKARVAELAEQQGFKPGRKQVKELKEQLIDELKVKAFTVQRSVRVWIDRKNGWMAVDSASRTKADDVLKLLIRAQPEAFPVGALKTKMMPSDCMTNWLAYDEAPTNFTVDRDAVLESAGEGRATVRIKNQTLDGETVTSLLAGKKCTQLAMTWDSKVSFAMDAGLTIKRISPLDIMNESTKAIADEQERFDADFLIMADTFSRMLTSISEALGGSLEVPAEPMVHDLANDNSDPGATLPLAAPPAFFSGEGDDPLFDQAVAIIMKNKRASISLIQRHLRLGYNRAARLIEAMEQRGIVSAMDASGSRTILNLGGEAA